MMWTRKHYVSNGEGWLLELKQCRHPRKFDPKRRPLMIIPGYGMNAFIFGYHPSGQPLEEYLADQGFEVWSVNLRDQGGSLCDGGTRRYSLKDLALTDLTVAIDFVLQHSRSKKTRIDLVGCSLGGTLAYLQTAFNKKNRVGTLAALGAPLRWEAVHPLIKLLFVSPWVVGYIPVQNTRQMVRRLLPVLLKFPKCLEMYLHADIVNTSNIRQLTETVETPSRFLNRQLAEWVKTQDLLIGRKNLTVALGKVTNSLICIMANSDGIVPMPTAASAYENIGTPDHRKELLVVGTEDLRFAHADLFISDFSHKLVFEPLANHLERMNS